MAGPFGQIIAYIDDSHIVEYMACWFKFFRDTRRHAKIEERGKGEPHISSFIRNEGAA